MQKPIDHTVALAMIGLMAYLTVNALNLKGNP
jgi:hypothetical protein